MPSDDKKKNLTLEQFLDMPDIKTILEKAGKTDEAEPSKEEVSRPLENVPTSGQNLSRLPVVLPKKTRDAILVVIRESNEKVTVKDMTVNLKSRGLDANFEQVKKSMNRLVDEKLLSKTKIDGISYYDYRKEGQVEKLAENIEEMEKQLTDFITEEEMVIPDVHKVIMVLSKENIKAMHRDKTDGSRMAETSNEPPSLTGEQVMHVVLNSLHTDSIYQRWARTSIPSQTKEIRGGFQENIKITEQTGFIGSMKAQVYGTGTLWLSFDFSEHPIEFTRWREFEQWLTGIMQGRCGYGFLELTHYFTMSTFEWSIDKEIRKLETRGGYTLTVKDFDDAIYSRIYSKTIDGKTFERHEVGVNGEMPYDRWLPQAQALLFGGKGLHWAIKQQHGSEQFNKIVSTHLVEHGKILKMNSNAIRTILTKLAEQDNINKELLEFLKKKKAE